VGNRKDLTTWISPDLAWHAAAGTGRRGRPPTFSDAAIQAVLTLMVLYQLPLRAAQGMAGSLIRLADLDLPVPHHSTLSRRQKSLTVEIPYRARDGPLHLVIDSTGLKVLGEGEWKVRKHGADKRRVWRKVHLVIDADSHEVRAVEMTDHRHGDGEIVPGLLAQLPKAERIGVISGDGAYDTRGVYEASASRPAPWSYRHGETANHGRGGPPERPSGTRRSAPPGTSEDGCGSAGVGTTAAAWPRRRCHASSVSVSASRPATPPVRSPRCRSAAPSSTPSAPSACPAPSPVPDQSRKGKLTPSA
jgi:hypothetical protein